MTKAAGAGFSSVVVACEPTGHCWRVLDQIAEQAGAGLVCAQPLLVHRARGDRCLAASGWIRMGRRRGSTALRSPRFH